MKKTILVTGGAGFIGSHLIEELVKDIGNDIYSLDNYFTGTKNNHIKGATYIRGHTKDIDTLIDFAPDLIYHLGEYSRVEASFKDIIQVFDLNKIGTFTVLEFCRKTGAKLVYAGSSTKFADGGLGRNQSPYAWAKASNTELVQNYGEWFNLDYAITYFYNVYGGREISTGYYATVIGIFKDKYLSGLPLGIVAPGTQKRNFTHISDIINGLILVGNKGQGDEYGIGNKRDFSILEVAGMFDIEINMLPERAGNRMGGNVDTEKTEQLGWAANIGLVEHIKEFIREAIR